MLDNSRTRTSVAVRLWSGATSIVHRAAETSTAVRIATFFLYSNAPPEEQSVHETSTDAGGGGIEDDKQSTLSDNPPASDAGSDGVVGGSRLYEAINGGRNTLANSVTYRLLAGREKPREIIIDLRKPALVATTRRSAVTFYRMIRRLSPTSGAAGVVYRGGLRFRRQPVRLVSIIVLALVFLVLAGEAISGSDFGPSTLVWIGILIIAARGTQKTQSFEELAAVRFLRGRIATRGAGSEDDGDRGDHDPDR